MLKPTLPAPTIITFIIIYSPIFCYLTKAPAPNPAPVASVHAVAELEPENQEMREWLLDDGCCCQPQASANPAISASSRRSSSPRLCLPACSKYAVSSPSGSAILDIPATFVARNWENASDELWQMAKRVDGWGRVHAVAELEPENQKSIIVLGSICSLLAKIHSCKPSIQTSISS